MSEKTTQRRYWCCATPINEPHVPGCCNEVIGPLDYDAPARVEELSHLARLTGAKVLYELGQTNDAIFELLDALIVEETKRQAQAHGWLRAIYEPPTMIFEDPTPKVCDSVLMIAGADYRCEMQLSTNGRHEGWGHANQAAQAIWKTDYA